MKLKYLLPVATIASVATVVTPLVTSCGDKWDFKYDNLAVETLELETEPLESYTGTDLLKDYLSNCKENEQILGDDFAYALHSDVYVPAKHKTFSCKISISDINLEKKLITAKAYYQFETKDDGMIQENEYVYKNMRVEFANLGDGIRRLVPSAYLLYKGGKADDAATLIKNDDASITGWSKEVYPYGREENYKYNYQGKNVTANVMKQWSSLYEYSRIRSWYLKNIPL